LKHAGAVLENFVVPEAQQAPALLAQSVIAAVVFAGDCMLTAIDLDDQPRFDTGEIDDIRRDWKLPPEPPSERIAPQLPPKQLLGIGHIPAEASGAPPHR